MEQGWKTFGRKLVSCFLRESFLIMDVYISLNIRHIQFQILINKIRLFDLALYLVFIRFLYYYLGKHSRQ